MVHSDHLLHAWCNLVCRLQRVTSARLHLFRRLGGDFPQFQCYVAFHYWVCLTHETLLPPNGQALYSAVLRAGTPVDTSTVVANAKDSEAVSNSFPIGGVHLRPSLMKQIKIKCQMSFTADDVCSTLTVGFWADCSIANRCH